MFTNRDCDQLHIIYPDLSGNRPRLQRMVAHRGQPGRTVVQQVANPMATAAAIDRVVHHSVILEFDVPSYRTNAAQQRGQAEEVNRQI